MNARHVPLSRRRGQRGSAIVEFGLIASVLIMLLIGIFEFGRVLFYWNTASEAVRLGARTAVVCDVNAAGVTKRVRSLMPLLSNANVSVNYSPASCDVNSCAFVTVSVTNVTVKTMIPVRERHGQDAAVHDDTAAREPDLLDGRAACN